MGCASSSPLVNGGLVDSAKTSATEMMNTGEKAMNGKLQSWLHASLSYHKKINNVCSSSSVINTELNGVYAV